jgi:hypothetical protein
MKLPAEVRLMIFEFLIPNCEISPYRLGFNCFGDAASLVRVNKQISAETQLLLYESKKRPCLIGISASSMSALRSSYPQSMRAWKEAPVTHVKEQGLADIARFSYYILVIDFMHPVKDDAKDDANEEKFFDLLESIQGVVYDLRR